MRFYDSGDWCDTCRSYHGREVQHKAEVREQAHTSPTERDAAMLWERTQELEAEVARLREALRVLIEDGNPWEERGPHGATRTECRYCGGTPEAHHPACVWLTAEGLLPKD